MADWSMMLVGVTTVLVGFDRAGNGTINHDCVWAFAELADRGGLR
jgi:hypothetical protein